ncbi:hypothetical protein ACLK1T_17505 [Escherichia coli]
MLSAISTLRCGSSWRSLALGIGTMIRWRRVAMTMSRRLVSAA